MVCLCTFRPGIVFVLQNSGITGKKNFVYIRQTSSTKFFFGINSFPILNTKYPSIIKISQKNNKKDPNPKLGPTKTNLLECFSKEQRTNEKNHATKNSFANEKVLNIFPTSYFIALFSTRYIDKTTRCVAIQKTNRFVYLF